MDDALRALRADPDAVKEQIARTNDHVRPKGEMLDLIAGGVARSVMVNNESSASALRGRQGLQVYANPKVPPGYAAVYGENDRLIGMYRVS